MKLSIVIVSYNVKYFLQQLLLSINRNNPSFEYEIIVVDNSSVDGSVEMVKERFPSTILIENNLNVGFSKANNQGIQKSQGDYVLILNPDTLIQEDTLTKSINYMDRNKDVGALGVKMMDGGGNYLPESKRGFPTPMVAFYKIFGLAHLFPKSSLFNHYYLGHLDKNAPQEIEVLTGAFMMIRKSVIQEVGSFDEQFFMYGEDIDLSYRIHMAGYKIIYYPETSIIHFKGESTKKGNIGYVNMFYEAMKKYAKKHYSSQDATLLSSLVNLGIFFRAFLSHAYNFFKKTGPIILDFILIIAALAIFKNIWARLVYNESSYYAYSSINLNILLYAIIWVLSLFFLGAYDKLFAWRRFVRGIMVGWILIAITYAFLGPLLRPSRALVFFGGIIVFSFLSINRLFLFRIIKGHFKMIGERQKKYLFIGDFHDAEQVTKLIAANHPNYIFKGVISVSKANDNYLGSIEQLDQIVSFYDIQEIIFSLKTVASSIIMQWMTILGQKVTYKIAPDKPISIIGSHSKNQQGELYTFDVRYNIDESYQKRNKRIIDLAFSFCFLLFAPVSINFVFKKRQFINNCILVISGQKTWVSYHSPNEDHTFPFLKEGIISPATAYPDQKDPLILKDLDFYYARDYSVAKDIQLIISNFRHLGNNHESSKRNKKTGEKISS